MHVIEFIHDLAIIMLAAGIVTVVFHLLRQPVVLGYIVAGVLIGPHTPPYTFVTNEGALLKTEDTAKLTPVAGMPNVFQQTTEYKVTKGTGRFEGAKGTFTNHGETDLKRGLLTLRYEGKICGIAD